MLPGPAPQEGDEFPADKTSYELPMAVQDRSFNTDGSLFYPDTRAFFDGITGPDVPETDLSPIWNPEFFGNMLMVSGDTWPFLPVEQRRYRLRVLNGGGPGPPGHRRGRGRRDGPGRPGSAPRPPASWESGCKDTAIAHPGQATRVKATFQAPGQFVWHCHILEHEDNEMMRPYRIGPPQPGQPT